MNLASETTVDEIADGIYRISTPVTEATTRTLLCGDLLTQPGAHHPALTEADIFGPSEAMRSGMDYFAHGRDTRPRLEWLARIEPRTLACMHGAAWTGDGAQLLRALADALG